MATLVDIGRQSLGSARLPSAVEATCRTALLRQGRLFSPLPIWSRLFLAWIEALEEPPYEPFFPAAVACEYMAAGYDLLDAIYDHPFALSFPAHEHNLPAGVVLLLLAQELIGHLNLPSDRCARAGAALARGGRRALMEHVHDYSLRQMSAVSPDATLAVLRHRSGMLVAAVCQCAALLTGAPQRTVVLAGRFGRALGCAAQLEDDLIDHDEDTLGGRVTLPVVLAQLYPNAPELVDATTWVTMRSFLHEAALTLTRLPLDADRLEGLWMLLPIGLRTA